MRREATILAAALAAALIGQASAHASMAGAYGLSATFEPNYFVLEMRLPALCLRLQAQIPGFIVASARMLTCTHCAGATVARSWS